MSNCTKRILELIKLNNVTKAKLEKECSLGNGTIGKWEKGISKPSYGSTVKIAHYFGVTPDYLLGYTNNVKVKHLSVSNFNDISVNSEEISKTTEILSLCEDLSDKDIEFVIKLIKLVREYSQE